MMRDIGREKLEERLAELRQAREEVLAQLQMIQGAITEIESFWLPWVEEKATTEKEEITAEIAKDAENKEITPTLSLPARNTGK